MGSLSIVFARDRGKMLRLAGRGLVTLAEKSLLLGAARPASDETIGWQSREGNMPWQM